MFSTMTVGWDLEPYNGRFHEFGFDGLIKCVFSGYEARLCAGVDVPTHELRLHPYLFPVGPAGGARLLRKAGTPLWMRRNTGTACAGRCFGRKSTG